MARKSKLRAAVIVALVSITAGGWLARAYLSRAEPDDEDALALSIIGGWWSISGERHLALQWEGRRAALRDYSTSEAGTESVGSWRTTKTTLIVHVAGAAGEVTQELELVGTDAEMFLAPVPAAQARLMDSWIADHEQDEDEISPSDSKSREARAADHEIASGPT